MGKYTKIKIISIRIRNFLLLDESSENTLLVYARYYILIRGKLQGHPTRNATFEIDIPGTHTAATMNPSTSIFTKHVDI